MLKKSLPPALIALALAAAPALACGDRPCAPTLEPGRFEVQSRPVNVPGPICIVFGK